MFAELFALDEKIKRRISFILLALLVLIASMPAFAPILKGCDTSFHLYRIIGIAEALSDGVFPVRMQYSQMQGLGFPVSIMYGDIFLYFPALLYKAGLSLTAAYRVFVFVSNCFVVCITYILTKRFANSRIMAFSATTVWTLGTYRLVDLYVRGAAGEYSALAFFPLVAYGLWAAFTLRGKSTTKIAPSIWIAFGMTGIILSHVISVVLVFFALLPLLIVLAICGNRKKKGWLSVLGACGITLGASLWFVIPFLWWYSTQDMWQSLPEVALSVAYVGYNVGTLGQFLQVFPSFAYDYSYPLDYGAYHELPLSLGCGAASLLICALLSLVVKQGIHNKKKSDSSLKTSASRSDCASAGVFATRSDCVGTGVFAGKSAIQGNCAGTGAGADAGAGVYAGQGNHAGAGVHATQNNPASHKFESGLKNSGMCLIALMIAFCICLVLCCCQFLWNENIPFMKQLFAIQFPWRFLGPILFICTLAGLLALVRLSKFQGLGAFVRCLCIFICLITCIEGAYCMTSGMTEVKPQLDVSYNDDFGGGKQRAGIATGNYLPISLDHDTFNETTLEMIDKRDNDELGFSFSRHSDAGRVFDISFDGSYSSTTAELPLIFYDGYEIVSTSSSGSSSSSSSQVSLHKSDRGFVELSIPENFTGTISIKWEEPGFWHIAEVVSALVLLVLLISIFWQLRKNPPTPNSRTSNPPAFNPPASNFRTLNPRTSTPRALTPKGAKFPPARSQCKPTPPA